MTGLLFLHCCEFLGKESPGDEGSRTELGLAGSKGVNRNKLVLGMKNPKKVWHVRVKSVVKGQVYHFSIFL